MEADVDSVYQLPGTTSQILPRVIKAKRGTSSKSFSNMVREEVEAYELRRTRTTSRRYLTWRNDSTHPRNFQVLVLPHVRESPHAPFKVDLEQAVEETLQNLAIKMPPKGHNLARTSTGCG